MTAGKTIVKLRRDLLPECATCNVKHPVDPSGKECVIAYRAKADLLRRQLHRELARRTWAESVIGMLETQLVRLLGRRQVRPSRWERLRPAARARWLTLAEGEVTQFETPMKHRHVWKRVGANTEKGYAVACEICTATGFKHWQEGGGYVEITGIGSSKEPAPVSLEPNRENVGKMKNKD